MMRIRLLGPPALERDGAPARAPRGRKAWAVLGYLLLTERPSSRRHLAELFFAEADDPLGAVRWTLAELRRSLDLPDAFAGDPVSADLGDEVEVDVRDLLDGIGGIDPLRDVSGELLEGVDLVAAPEFESWLLVERHRVAGALEAELRRVATGLLATGRAREAVPFASRAVELNPLEEGNHELLVRSLATAGDPEAARRQVELCAELLRAELGVEPSSAIHDAARVGAGTPTSLPLNGRAAAVSQLEAGRAAIVAGAVDAGVQCLRTAVAEAERSGDDALHARTLTALGSALIHSIRGRDEEGSVVMIEAIDIANRVGDTSIAVTGYRELGFVEVQAGRRATGEDWLAKAAADATTDAELAAIFGVRGMNASDRGDYPTAFAHLGESVDRAAACGDHRQQAWSLSLVARAHLLRGEHGEASRTVTDTIELVQSERWVAFQPWPQAFRAELDLQAGDVEGAGTSLEHAWAMAIQLDDPCWEGVTARGLGLVHAERGDHNAASVWLSEAETRSNRVSDRYQWVRAYVLDAMATEALDQDDHDRARPLVSTLSTLAARCAMREFLVRSELHRHRLGDTAALATARTLSADVDNPALAALLG